MRLPHSARPRGPRHDEGGALLEFALIVPLLLLLFFGIYEFGRAWNVYQVVTDAAREGARTAAVVNPSTTEAAVRQVVFDALTRASLDPNLATVTLTGIVDPLSGSGDAPTGSPATVAISYPYLFTALQPMMQWTAAQASVTISTSFVMRNE